MLSSDSIVSTPRTVRPCSPWGGRWNWTLEDNMVDGLFFWTTLKRRRGGHTPLLQAGAETSDTGAEAVKLDPGSSWEGRSGEWVPVSGMKMRSLVGLSVRSAFHRWSAQFVARMLFLSDELLCCCTVGADGSLDLRRRASALYGQVSGQWSRCPGSMARRVRDNVVPLRRSSAGWMPARSGRLFAGVERRRPDTICKASLMAGSKTRVWALRHQTGAQYSAVACTRARVAVRRVVASAPSRGQQAASRARRLMSASCEVTQGVMILPNWNLSV